VVLGVCDVSQDFVPDLLLPRDLDVRLPSFQVVTTPPRGVLAGPAFPDRMCVQVSQERHAAVARRAVRWRQHRRARRDGYRCRARIVPPVRRNRGETCDHERLRIGHRVARNGEVPETAADQDVLLAAAAVGSQLRLEVEPSGQIAPEDEHDFEADVPADVRVRDVILAFKDQIDGLTDREAGERFGREAFGGPNWEDDFSGSTQHTSAALETMMCVRELTDADGNPPGERVRRALCAPVPRPEAVRLLLPPGELGPGRAGGDGARVLVPAEAAWNRRAWIEMDKFRHTLAAGERAVVYRPAQESSVIRKPAPKPPVAFIDPPETVPGPEADEENYCTCGWPYNLLLPRGTEAGAPYRLLAAITDYAGDRVPPLRPPGRTCGSISFCGLRDDLFPDAKAMGYPFHRPFRSRTLAESVAAHPQWAVRDLTIRHVPAGDQAPYVETAP
jgi:hypothetical protein